MPEPQGLFDRALSKVDDLQQATRPSSLVVAVLKRYSEDRASRQAALITFYGFLSVFPLLLLLVTAVALLVSEPTLKHHLVDSVLAQFPVIGPSLENSIEAISIGNNFAVTASILGLLWGCFGITNSLQAASAALWRRPRTEDPSLWGRLGKGLALLGVLGSVAVVSSVGAGLAANSVERVGLGGNVGRTVAYGAVLVVNAAGYLGAFKLLSPPGTSWRALWPGTVLGAVGWTALQVLAGWLIGHRLQHANQFYGSIAVVLGLIFWINLGAQLFLYSTELNLVISRREWPRSFRTAAV
jgi:YihY family inner membrane protein